MLIYFLGGEKYPLRQVERSIPADAGKVVAFSKIGEFTRALRSKNPSLILADHNFMRGRFFNINDFCSEQKIGCPLLLFNSPWAKGGRQDEFCYYQLKPFIQNYESARYRKILESLFEQMECAPGAENTALLSKFKLETKISDRMWRTAKFILQKEGGASIQEIQAHLSSGGKEISANGVQILMTRLRKVCRTDGGRGMNLCKEDGKYLFRFL